MVAEHGTAAHMEKVVHVSAETLLQRLGSQTVLKAVGSDDVASWDLDLTTTVLENTSK
jgi:hypothetical protein